MDVGCQRLESVIATARALIINLRNRSQPSTWGTPDSTHGNIHISSTYLVSHSLESGLGTMRDCCSGYAVAMGMCLCAGGLAYIGARFYG